MASRIESPRLEPLSDSCAARVAFDAARARATLRALVGTRDDVAFAERALASRDASSRTPHLNKKETIAFYQDVLKFEIVSEYDGYIITKKDKIEIHLWKTENPIIPTNTGCYIRVNKSIDLLYREYESKGVMHEHGKLDVKPWGMKQFSIRDNSGNIIHFGQNAY